MGKNFLNIWTSTSLNYQTLFKDCIGQIIYTRDTIMSQA